MPERGQPGTSLSMTRSRWERLNWSESPDHPDCQITGLQGAQTLACDFGDWSLATQ